MLHSALLDFQSGNSHNMTTRIYEKTASRITQLGGTTASNQYFFDFYSHEANPDKVAGISDMIFQPADAAWVAAQISTTVGGVTAPIEIQTTSNQLVAHLDSAVVNMSNQFNTTGSIAQVAKNFKFNYTDNSADAGSAAYLCCGIKLVSGILKNSRYVPLLALKGSGLTLELTLAEANNAFTCTLQTGAAYVNSGSSTTGYNSGGGLNGTITNPAGAGANLVQAGTDSSSFSYTLQNVEYIGSTIEFDEAFTVRIALEISLASDVLGTSRPARALVLPK